MGIDDPQLQKPDKVACVHMRAGQGCAIHDHLPVTCRNWFCGWRFLNLSDAMRPDRSRILLIPEIGNTPGYEKGGLRIVLIDSNRADLFQDELLSFVARCVIGGVPVYLNWGDGPLARRGLVNEDTRDAAARGDKPAFIAALRVLLDAMARQVAMDVITAQNRTNATDP
jgi:hypothetical protein